MPLEIYTDFKTLFDVITKCLQTQEGRVIIDLPAVNDASKSQEISNDGSTRDLNYPAGSMTIPAQLCK